MSDVLKQLRKGDSVARGTLSFDRDKAREKLRKFRLPDPHLYVLQFVRTASALGASNVVFEIEARRVQCTFDAVFEPEVLADLWGAALNSKESDAARAAYYLAIGLGSASALRPARIEVKSGSHCLTIIEEHEEVTKVTEDSGTTIVLEEKFRFGHLFQFFQSIRGQLAEASALRQYAGFSSMEIEVNGTPLVDPRLVDVSLRRDFPGPIAEVSIGLRNEGPYQLRVVYVQHGVAVGERTETAIGEPAVACVESANIQTDLTGLSIAQGNDELDVYREPLLDAYFRTIVVAGSQGQLSWPYTRVLKGQLRRTVLLRTVQEFGVLYRSRREAEIPVGDGERKLRAWLVSQPLFEVFSEDARQGFQSVMSVARGHRVEYLPPSKMPGRYDQIYESPSRVAAALPGRPLIDLRYDPLQRSVLLDALGGLRGLGFHVIDASAELARYERRRTNLARFESQPSAGIPEEFGGMAISHPPYQARIAAGRADANTLTVYVGGRKLRVLPLRTQTGLSFAVDGPFELSFECDNVMASPETDALFQRVARLVSRYIDEIARGDVDGTGSPKHGELYLRWLGARARQRWPSNHVKDAAITTEDFDTALQSTLSPLLPCPPEATARMSWADDIGAVAYLRLFWHHELGTTVSLRKLVSSGRPILMAKAAQAELAGSVIRADGDLILVEANTQTWLLDIGEPFVDGTRALERAQSVAAFEEKPLYQRSALTRREVFGALARTQAFLAVREEEVRGFNISVRLLDLEHRFSGSSPERSRVDILYQSRLLSRVEFAADRGVFDIVVQGSVVPNRDLSGVDPRGAEDIMTVVNEVIARTLEAWARERIADGETEESHLSALYELGVELSEHGRVMVEPRETRGPDDLACLDEALIPVWRFDGSEATASFASVQELREATRSGQLPYTRSPTMTSWPADSTSTPIVRLGEGGRRAHLHRLIPNATLVDLTEHGPEAKTSEAAAFLEREPEMFHCFGEGTLWKGAVGGYDIVMRFRAVRPDERPQMTGRIFHQGRVLAHASFPGTFGHTTFAIGGEAVRPNRRYNGILGDLSAIEEALGTALIRVVTRVSELLIAGEGPGALVGAPEPTAEQVRAGEAIIATLVAAVGMQHSLGEPLAEALCSAPLFRDADGDRYSFHELGEFGNSGVLQVTCDHGVSGPVLFIEESHLPSYRIGLRGHFVFDFVSDDRSHYTHPGSDQASPGPSVPVKMEPVEAAKTESDSSPLQVVEDPVLRMLRSRLLSVRGDRFDLLGDAVLSTIRWSDESFDGLARVGPLFVELSKTHRLMQRMLEEPTEARVAFVVSVVYSSINRYYAEITDSHDREFQSRMLAHTREELRLS